MFRSLENECKLLRIKLIGIITPKGFWKSICAKSTSSARIVPQGDPYNIYNQGDKGVSKDETTGVGGYPKHFKNSHLTYVVSNKGRII